ncbi:DUF2785 domain-containing protein [Clostridium sp.]|uniref:DUF2785 domain-containing protein n=2 Tax=Clostridium sp. TaxID=1506 RepID=UPI003217CA0D
MGGLTMLDKINSNLLKEKLIKIKMNGYINNDPDNVIKISLDMMKCIGSVDYELRDELIYSTFVKWTINNVITSEQMHQLLKISLDEEHLFYKIGEKDTDSVFTRTFSLLFIPLALYLDSNTKFLTKEETIYIKDRVIKYLELEKDIRGYVVEKGWAHSTAHGADALDEIAKSQYINYDELLEILHAIKNRVCINNYTYINKEDDRLVTAVMTVFSRNLIDDNEIVEWIKDFSNIEKTGKYPEEHHLIVNIRNFLRSLYFEMLYKKSPEIFTKAISETLENL